MENATIPRATLARELHHILRPYWRLIMLAIAAGVTSGFATTALLAAINAGLHRSDPLSATVVLSFAVLCAIVFLGDIASELSSNFIGQSGVRVLRRELCERVLSAPIQRIEAYGTPRIFAILNQDVDMISLLFFNASSFSISVAVSVACFAYLLFLSPLLGLVGLMLVLVGAAIHFVAVRGSYEGFEESRNGEDDLQAYLRTICDGAKELRIDQPRRAFVLHRQIMPVLKRIQDTKYGSMRVLAVANSAGSLLYFVIIGLVVALATNRGVAPETLSAFVLTLLFVRGPVTQIAQLIPFFAQAKVAFGRVLAFCAGFRERENAIALSATPCRHLSFETIDLKGIRFRYPDGRFEIGPLDLDIRRGELLFITGQNGGGKTTFAKVLLGLYPPTEGEIGIDGNPLKPEDLDLYRQLFVTVFADFHLFADLSPELMHVDPADVTSCLKRLRLDGVVWFRDGAFTTTELSTGQRKRLALLHAWLSDRPVILFDEWAADQDPEFRRTFYLEILPELKAAGRTVVAIVHDDRYFDVADRTIHIENGRTVAADGRVAQDV